MFVRLVLFYLLTCCCLASANADVKIDWRLENGFRMFLNPQHTKIHRDVYLELSEEERKSPVLSIERKLALKYPSGWSSQMFYHTCWHKKKRQYHNCRGKKNDYLHPTSHKIIAKLSSYAKGGQCVWKSFDASAKRKILLEERKQDCQSSVKLTVPYPIGAIIEVTKGNDLIVQQSIKVQDLFIVGLGDSFASGEGNPDRPVKFDDKRTADYGIIVGSGLKLKNFPARGGNWRWIGDKKFARRRAGWLSQACHRSLYSHQFRAALHLAIENKQRAVTYVGFACSGAEILVGLLDRYKGNDLAKYNPKYSQISSAALAVCGPHKAEYRTYSTTFTYSGAFPSMENLALHKCNRQAGHNRKIDFLLVSIGGNDVGFSRLVANAILKDKSALKSLGGWMGQIYHAKDAENRMEELRWRYKAVRRAFHNILYIPWNESDRIILVAYPRIGFREDGITVCPDGNRGMDLHPVFKVNSRKVRAGEKFSVKLNELMQDVAWKYGWTFVDEHREKFLKHGYCAMSGQEDHYLKVPRKTKNGWVPYHPSTYKAYKSRQRWIRTPNDVYMATHEHVDRILIRKVLRLKNVNAFQLIYAGVYGGSFHPTAEGQAAIADAVVKKIHYLIKKYKY